MPPTVAPPLLLLLAAGVAAADIDVATAKTHMTSLVLQEASAVATGVPDDAPVLAAVSASAGAVSLFDATGTAETVVVPVDGASGAHAVLFADFAGDEEPELVVATDSAVLVFASLGGPIATSSTALELPAGAVPAALHAADVDADGSVDLLVALQDEVRYFRGPTLDANVTVATGLGGPVALATCESNVVVADGDNLLLFLNDGTGGFSLQQTVFAARAVALAAGDVDGDGDVDVVAANPTDDKLATFTYRADLQLFEGPALVTAIQLTAVQLLDFDLDGDLDVASAEDGAVAWYSNDGDGAFTLEARIATVSGVHAVAEPIDLDGDGDADLGIGSANASVSVAWLEVQSVPFAPTSLAAVVLSSGAVELSWAAPESDNGAAVTAYVVSPGGWVSNTTSVTVDYSELSMGQESAFEVQAQSYRGLGPASTSVTATPATAVEIAAETAWARSGAPTMIKAGDLDGDGVLDLVVALRDQDKVVWYDMGAGGAEVVLSSDAQRTRSLDVADIDGDGDLDVVATSRDNNSLVLLTNDGAGTFDAGVKLALPSIDPIAVRVGDATGDGAADLVVAFEFTGDVVVLSGDDFGNYTTIASGLNAPRDFDLADLNADGYLDLVIGTGSGDNLRWFAGPSFASAVQTFTGLDNVALAQAADIDGDSDLDVVVACYVEDRVVLFENDGTGSLTAGVDIATGLDGVYLFEIGDLDLDGDLDVIAALYDANEVVWVPNSGNGQFEDAVTLASGLTAVWDVALFDADGDGDDDVAFAATVAQEVGWLAVETAPFAPVGVSAVALNSGAVSLSWTAAEDNGAPVTAFVVSPGGWTTSETNITLEYADLVMGQSYDFAVQAQSYRGLGPASASVTATPKTAVEVLSSELLAATSVSQVEVGDLTSDGVPDVVVSIPGTNTVKWFDMGNDAAEAVLSTEVSNAQGLALADLNDDGALDVVAAALTGDALFVFTNPFTEPAIELALPAGSGPRGVRVGDVTGDGVGDIVFSLAYGDAVGYFAGPEFAANWTTVATDVDYPYMLDVADLDGDGVAEVIVPAYGTGQVFVYSSNALVSTVSGISTPMVARAGDMDGDGDLDVVVGENAGTRIWRLDNDGTGVLAAADVIASGLDGSWGLALGDLDLDGDLDAVVTDRGRDEVWWVPNGEDPIVLATDIFNVWAVELADFDGDGDLDVVTCTEVRVLTLGTAPFAPVGVSAVALNSGAVSLSWAAPEDDNGAPVTAYVVSPGGWTATETNITVDFAELVMGQEYAFEVQAQSYRGLGPASANVTATPTTAVEIAADTLVSSLSNPKQIAAGDLDGDGLPDLVVAFSNIDTVAWYSQGVEHVLSTTVNAPWGVDLGDVDYDEDLDIVVSLHLDDALLVFTNDAGTFDDGVELPLPTGSGPWGVRVGDVTGDGVPDIAFTLEDPERGNVVGFFEGPDFSTNVTVDDSGGSRPMFLDLADLDGDSFLDIVVPYVSSGAVLWYRGPDFTAAEPALSVSSPPMARAVDMDADGDLDVLATSWNTDTVVLFENEGSGVFAEGVDIAAVDGASYTVVFGDLDLDGDVDAAVTLFNAGRVVWIPHAGGLQFDDPIELLADLDGAWGAALLDADGDGDNDLAVAGATLGQVRLLALESVPFAPANVSAVVLNSGSVVLSWGAPEDNGAPVTAYVVAPNGWTTSETSITVELVMGQSYAFEVQAQSYRGLGPASASVTATPATAVEIGNRTVLGSRNTPRQVSAGDLDGDGFPDLAVAYANADTVAWYESKGVEHILSTTVDEPWGVEVGDVDGDGDADVVVPAFGGDALHIFTNDAGTFDDGVELPLPAGSKPLGVRVGDVTGDGLADIVFTADQGDYVGLFVGPDFSVNMTVVGSEDRPMFLDLADLNGDGALDIIVPFVGASEVLWYSGPDFAVQSALDVSSPTMVRAADMDDDGDLDLVVCRWSGGVVTIFENDGSGVFAEGVNAATGTNSYGLAIGDLDLDGDLDIVQPLHTNDEVLWIPNAGGLQFEDAITLLTDVSGAWHVAFVDGDLAVTASVADELLMVAIETAPFAPANLSAVVHDSGSVSLSWTAPEDDNGAPVTAYVVSPNGWTTSETEMALEFADLVIGQEYDFAVQAQSYRGLGPASPTVATTPATAVEIAATTMLKDNAGAPAQIAVGDIDGDGLPNVAVTSINSASFWVAADGTLTYLGPTAVADAIVSARGIDIADIDGDGDLDVVLAAESFHALYVFTNQGDGTLDDGVELPVDDDSKPWAVRVGDVTGDGIVDLVFTSDVTATGYVGYFAGPDFFSTTITVIEVLSRPWFLDLGDLDADGVQDVIVCTYASSPGYVQWYRGGASLSAPAEQTFDGMKYVVQVRAADMDNDGDLDVVAAEYTGNHRVLVFENVGGALQLPLEVTADIGGAHGFAVGDLDLDGNLDVVVGDYYNAQVVWIANKGDLTFGDAITLESGVTGAWGIGLLDMDLDGDNDVVAGSYSNSEVLLLTVETVPFAPTGLAAVALNSGAVSLSWTAPEDDNGAPVTAYVVSPGGWTTSETNITLEFADLVMGQPYDFAVQAQSYRGLSPASANATTTTPATAVELGELADVDTLSEPSLLEVGDVNGDGMPDVVVTCRHAGAVQWVSGSSITTLSNAVSDPIGVAVADVDHDEDLDIVVAARDSNALFLFTNLDGLGAFDNGVELPLSAGSEPWAVRVADVTGDGWADIVFAADLGDYVGFLAGPSFVGATVIATNLDRPYQLDVADIDADSHPDIIVPVYIDDELRWYRGPNFTEAQQTLTGDFDGPAMARAVDLDADGDLDVCVTMHHGDTLVLFENDEGELRDGVDIATDVGGPVSLAFADLDLDGDLDVLSALYGGDAVVWVPNAGSLTFEDPIVFPVALDGAWGVAAGDFDGDGDDDVAATASKSDVLHLLSAETVPLAPVGLVATPVVDGATVNVSWSTAGDNGAPVTEYTVTAGSQVHTVSTPWLMAAVAADSFAVQATSYRGTGPQSAALPYDPCFDGVRNANESDVDCSGSCVACADGALCVEDADCLGGACEAETGRCASCSDGVQNRDETEVDCGGQWCGPCLTCSALDYGVALSWGAVEGAEGYWVSGLGVVSGLNATVDGLPNYVSATVTVAAVPGGMNGSCEATPRPDYVVSVGDSPWGGSGRAVAIGDVDDDGEADRFVGGTLFPGNVTVFDGDVAPALADVNGDGNMDAVFGTAAGELYVSFGPAFSTSEWFGSVDGTDAAPSAVDDGLLVGTASGAVFSCSFSGNCSLAPELSGTSVAVCDAAGTVVAVGVSGEVTVDGLISDVTVEPGTTASCVDERTVALGAAELLSLLAHPEPPSALGVRGLLSLSSVNLTWAYPDVDGGLPVSEYVVVDDIAVGSQWAEVDALEGGRSYDLTVRAVNSLGESASSSTLVFEMPTVAVNASQGEAGQAVLSWALIDEEALALADSVRVSGQTFEPAAASGSTVVDGLNCSLHAFDVAFVGAAASELVGSGRMQAPPIGVCPGMCSASPVNGELWIDPSLEDPFVVECDGNWTTVDLDANPYAALMLEQASHVLPINASSGVVQLKTQLEAAVLAQPADAVAYAVDVATEIAVEANVPAAVVQMRVDGGAWTTNQSSLAAVDEGSHVLDARAVLTPWFVSGVVSAEWESDYTAATIGLVTTPVLFTPSPVAEFAVDASEPGVTYEYCLDGTTCSTLPSSVVEDVVTPSTVGAAPDNPATSPLSLNVTSDFGTSFAVSTDEGAWAVVTDLSVPLADGWHSVQVRAVDSLGNADPSPLAFGVAVGGDRWAPDTFAVASSDAVYVGDVVNVTVSADEAGCSFEYSLDSGSTWAALPDGASLAVAAEAVGMGHVFVRATDAAGNVDPAPAGVWWTVEPPETWFVSSSQAEGTGVAIQYSLDRGATWADSLGDLDEDGEYVLLARAVDASGAVDPSPAVTSFSVVSAASVQWALAPTAESPFAMAVFAVEEVSTSGCAMSWSLDGGAEAVVGDDGVFVAGPLLLGAHAVAVSVECDGLSAALEHEWTVAAEEATSEYSFSGLAEGVHSMDVFAVDKVGNVGPTQEYNWTVDWTAPETVLEGVDGVVVTTLSSLPLNASCVDLWGCVFNVTVDGVGVGLLKAPLVVPDLTEGSHSIAVTAVDFAGNVAANAVGLTVYVDTTPPVVSIEGANMTNAPSFTVNCSDLSGCASIDLFVDGSPVSNLTGLVLDDGVHVARAEATDGASNVAVVSLMFTVDTVAPLTVYGGPASLVVNASSFALNASCSDENECWLNPLDALDDGVHVVELWAEDLAGNVDESPVVLNVTVDTVAPVLSYVGARQSGQTLTLEVDCADLTRCEFDVSAASASAVDGLMVTATDGTHDVRVEVVDGAGNVGAPLVLDDLIFDSAAPVVTLTSVPEAYVAATSSDVEWAATDDNDFACECNGEVCTSPFTVDSTSEGAELVELVCADLRDNAAALNVSWFVDYSVPTTDLTTAVPAVTNVSHWAFAFDVDDASPTTASCALTGPLSVVDNDCVSPFVVDLSEDGTYAFNMSAIDAANNAGPQDGAVFRLDTVAPRITVTLQPDSTTLLQTVRIEFGCTKDDPDACGDLLADTDCSLAYSHDGGAREATADGVIDVTVAEAMLNELSTVVLYATDEAGNVGVDTVEWTWTDDAVSTSIFTGLPTPTNLYTFDFEWSTSQALEEPVFEYKLDDADWEEVGNFSALGGNNYTASFSVAEVGPHTLQIAVQGALQASDSWTWTVEHCALTDEVEYTSAAGLTVCEACPEGTVCRLGLAAVAPGYWWSQPPDAEIHDDSVLYPCRVEAACTGNWTATAGLCAEGYEGVVCDTCSPGYGRNLELECQPCGASDNTGIVALAATLFTVGLVVLATFIVQRSLSTTGTARAVSTVKIMANYFLMMGILKDMDLDWGGMLTKMFSYMGVASGAGAADVQLVNCVARVDPFDRFWLYFSVPVLLVVAPGVALWGYAGVRRLKWVIDGRAGGVLSSAKIWGHSKAFVYRQALLVLTYFSYPIVVTESFSALHCADIEGESRLVLDYSKECSGPEYAPILVIGALYATVVALGVPFGIYWAMHRHHATLTTAGKAQTQFFFFFGEFRLERYWWEMTVMARKVAMGAIAVLLNNHAQKMQVYVGTWLLLFSFTAQITMQPHQDSLQRNLETVAQGTVLASLLLGQGMAFERVTAGQRETFQMCVLVLNVAVMNGMGLALGREVWKEARGKLAHGGGGGGGGKRGAVELPTIHRARPSIAQQTFSTENPLMSSGPGPGRL